MHDSMKKALAQLDQCEPKKTTTKLTVLSEKNIILAYFGGFSTRSYPIVIKPFQLNQAPRYTSLE